MSKLLQFGVGGGGEVIETPIEDQTFVYAVNVEGVYRTTKAYEGQRACTAKPVGSLQLQP